MYRVQLQGHLRIRIPCETCRLPSPTITPLITFNPSEMTGHIDDVEARRVFAHREWFEIMNRDKRYGQVEREPHRHIYTREEQAAKQARLQQRRHEHITGVWADPDTQATWRHYVAIDAQDDRDIRSIHVSNTSKANRGSEDADRTYFATSRKSSGSSGANSDSATTSARRQWNDSRQLENPRSSAAEPTNDKTLADPFTFYLAYCSVVHVVRGLFHLARGPWTKQSL